VEQRLRQVLAKRRAKRIGDATREISAVLLPIYQTEGECYLIVTKRTQQVKEHKGQISFPGGAYQDGDGTLLNTALRECAEEIGLEPERVRILGELDDVITQTSNYIISPFVASIPWPYEFEVNKREIEEIIEAPISALLDKGCRREEREIIAGEPVIAYFYRYRGRVIWGATATILKQFLDIFTHAVEKGEG
jgi:8-oxo-dGTP pyrophosphatase MutT (NUDIX family)